MSRKPRPRPEAVIATADALAQTVQAQIGQRVGNVAIELSLAAGQVLRDDFAFTPEQILAFQQKLIARAKANRAQFAAAE